MIAVDRKSEHHPGLTVTQIVAPVSTLCVTPGETLIFYFLHNGYACGFSVTDGAGP